MYPFERFTERAKKVLTLADSYEPKAITETFVEGHQTTGNNLKSIVQDNLLNSPQFQTYEPQLATELGYGKAIHHILRRVADRTKEKGSLPELAEVEAIFREFAVPPLQLGIGPGRAPDRHGRLRAGRAVWRS